MTRSRAPTDPFAQGAGFVNPNGAADPGLVYPTTATEYRQYMVGLGVHFAPPNDTLTPISGSEPQPGLDRHRQPAGHPDRDPPRQERREHARRPTRASASVPGFTVTVTPSTLTLAPGADGDLHGHVLPRPTPPSATGPRAPSPGPTARTPCARRSRSGRSRSRPRPRCTVTRAPAARQTFNVTPGFTGNLCDDGLRPRRGDPDRGQRRHRRLRHHQPGGRRRHQRLPRGRPGRDARRAVLAGR